MLQQSQQVQPPHQQGEGQLPPGLIAQLLQAGLLNGHQNHEIRIEGLPPDAIGPVAQALANLRQRRGFQHQGARDGVEQRAADEANGQQRQPRRLRVININLRLSIRTLLQMLVFAVVAYQVRYVIAISTILGFVSLTLGCR